MTSPYTHLRTLINNESRHKELNRCLYLLSIGKDPYKKYYLFERPDPVPYWQRISLHDDYTTSLDALLPLWPEGWDYGLMKTSTNECLCAAVNKDEDHYSSRSRPTPALAMLDALLQVLEYEWEGKRV